MRLGEYLQINKKLKAARKISGLSQREMAKRLGISNSAYSNYENGYSEPPVEVLQDFCRHVEMTLPALLQLDLKDQSRKPIETFTEFIDDITTLHDMGIEINISSTVKGWDSRAQFEFCNPQMAALGDGIEEAYKGLQNKSMSQRDFDFYMQNLRQLYNVKIVDFIQKK